MYGNIFTQLVTVYNQLSSNITYFNEQGIFKGDNGSMGRLPSSWNFRRGFLNPRDRSSSAEELERIIKFWNSGKVVNFYFTRWGIKVKVFDGFKKIYSTKIIFISSNWLSNIFLSIKFRNLINK